MLQRRSIINCVEGFRAEWLVGQCSGGPNEVRGRVFPRGDTSLSRRIG